MTLVTAYTLIGIGTMLAGIGTLLTAVIALKTLRTSRVVKSKLAENTAITKQVRDTI